MQRERGVCAGKKKKDLVQQSASDELYLYLLQAGYTNSTLNLDTQTVAVVINHVNSNCLRVRG